MKETTITISILKRDLRTQVISSDFDNVIFSETGAELHTVSQIDLSGEYNKTYRVLADFVGLNDETVLIDGSRLFICLFDEIAVVDLTTDKVESIINYENYQLFGIYKFKSGYFVRGEGSNMFLDNDLACVWELGSVDIFANPIVENQFEIHDDYIAVYDWCGYRHFYDEAGMIKIEEHPEYDMNKNSF